VTTLVADEWSMLIHDLRTPLATVSTYTQLLLRQASNQDQPSAEFDARLRVIQEATLRIEHLVDRLAGRSAASPQTRVDLVDLTLRIAASSRRVKVVFDTREIQGAWDATGLERVLANLIDNAQKYSPADQPVLVTLRRTRHWAIIRVVDHGVGIPTPDLAHVFDRGFRASNAAGRADGSGLGLAAVKRIVRMQGGTVRIDSREGVGTAVIVRLPIQQPEELPS
jgi:two-component system sensor histidine kinase MprB